ncbi:MAG: STAS domain-containing protein [Chloroflexota bacterium]
MNITNRMEKGIRVVSIQGDLDGATAPEAQAAILPLMEPGGRMLLDMSQVAYMSSAGLRMLLLMYRTINGKGGKVALVGLSEELADTMSLTGFLDFFTCFETLELGLARFA